MANRGLALSATDRPQVRRAGRLQSVVGIATLSIMAWGCGDALSSDKLTDFAQIPGAPKLGWVEVERRHAADGTGWQCDSPGHLYLVSELRKRTPLGLPSSQPIDGAVWNGMLRVYLLKRLTESYPKYGKPGLRGQDHSFSWSDWLRGTLEGINSNADAAGLPQQVKAAALHVWVVCHVSVAEAARIRDLILTSKKEGR